MIQRSATGTFDLEFGKTAHTGEKSVAFTASAIFKHLHNLPLSAMPTPLSLVTKGGMQTDSASGLT